MSTTPMFSTQLLGQTEKAANAMLDRLLAEPGTGRLLRIPDDDHATVRLTDSGEQLYAQTRTATVEVTQRLWGDLPAQDLATAGRVLSTVLARANTELAEM
jgi:hypothetical protein